MVYLLTTTGVNLQLHYCMGKLSHLGLVQTESKKCATCGMKKQSTNSKGCCKDESKLVKNDSDQKAAENFVHAYAAQIAELPISVFHVEQSFVSITTKGATLSLAPPYSDKLSLFVLNRNFRI